MGGLFGGGAPEPPGGRDVFQPFNFGGLRGRLGPGTRGNVNITSTPERQALVDQLSQSFRNQSGIVSNRIAPLFESAFDQQLNAINNELLPQVEPGFGRLTEARNRVFEDALTRLEQRREAETGDLRENLARRRIAGSSFASDAQARQESAFQQSIDELSGQQAQSNAQSFLQELDITRNLINQRFQTETAQAQSALQLLNNAESLNRAATGVQLDELNFIAQLGSGLVSDVQRALGGIAQRQFQAAAESAAGGGGLLGTIGGQLLGPSLSGLGGELATGLGLAGGAGAGSAFAAAETSALLFPELAALAASDWKVKENVRLVDDSGAIPVYEWAYVDSPRRYQGVMAEDIFRMVPDAVHVRNNIAFIDYSKLPIEIKEVN